MHLEIIEEIFSVELDDKKIILDSKTGNYFELNSVGAEIVSLIQEAPKSLDETVEHLANKYEVKKDFIKKDVLEFVEECIFIEKIL